MGAIAALAAVAALAGGGVAAVGVHSLDGTNTKTVTTTVAAPANSGSSANQTANQKADAAFKSRIVGKTVAEIYKQAAPGVVTITSTSTTQQSVDPFSPFGPGGGSQQETSEGSGFVIDKTGRILTNAHVVSGASTVRVAFEDGLNVKATVLGRDSLYDLAVLKVNVGAGELHPLTLGSINDVETGDPVVAIGNPFGLDQTVTAGIVSAKDRIIPSPEGDNNFIPGAIQTDAAINHGNSGGPLIDSRGQVIAINAQLADPSVSGTDANAGVGFAVPIDLAKRALPDLEAGKAVSHPYMGIAVAQLNSSVSASDAKLPSEGLLITGVAKGSPAAAAGLKGGSHTLTVDTQNFCVGGDTITAIDGHSVATLDDLQERLSVYSAGQVIHLAVTGSDGSKRTVSLTVGSVPSSRQPLVSGGC